MSPDKIRWLVVQVAGLGYDFLNARAGAAQGPLIFKPLDPVLPGLTCSVQACFSTATYSCDHGIVGNGYFDRPLGKTFFWEQSDCLIQKDRIWQKLRQRGSTVAQLFWQQSLGAQSDFILSPAPIHKHHGGMIQDCYGRPDSLYHDLISDIGSAFPLHAYWGPFAGLKSSLWIKKATERVMSTLQPDLLLTYIPHLDYELQRSGPASAASGKSLNEVLGILADLRKHAATCGYNMLVFGDYAIFDVNRPLYPNRLLHNEGFLRFREIKKMLYPDVHASSAFAVADHQIAHIIVRDPSAESDIRRLFAKTAGVASILDRAEQKEQSMLHERTGDLVLIAEQDAWFAYPWWVDNRIAPEYARHIDIHSKPGYDPCELFWEGHPFRISLRTERIRGSHGSCHPGAAPAWACTTDFPFSCGTVVDLAKAFQSVLQ